jgi:hypothetical protein
LSLAGQLRGFGSQLDGVCQRLVHPGIGTLDQTAAEMENIAGSLMTCVQGLAGPPEEFALREAQALGARIRRTHRLLEGAAAFQEGWSRLFAGMAGGYTPEGRPAELQSGSRLQVQG